MFGCYDLCTNGSGTGFGMGVGGLHFSHMGGLHELSRIRESRTAAPEGLKPQMPVEQPQQAERPRYLGGLSAVGSGSLASAYLAMRQFEERVGKAAPDATPQAASSAPPVTSAAGAGAAFAAYAETFSLASEESSS